MNHLRDLGVSVAIDDFGSGYSALGSLQVLPIHAVKIDPRFLASGTAGAGNEAIVGAVIDVGRKFGLRVAAAGVESREQLNLLQQRGCHEAQGPYFSQAVDAETFRALVKEAKPLPAGKPAAIA
jgi:EAL domain-containing protein (putative c-di-GMP-specific phosphodiesterase class I)